MSAITLKDLARKQRTDKLNEAAAIASKLQAPKEGWIKLVRHALGMTGEQLGKRLGVTKVAVSKKEKSELDGSISLKNMREIASAMDCHFVYAIVPKNSIESIISEQATILAKSIVLETSKHMALEDQALSKEKLQQRINSLANDLSSNPTKELWNE